jgi:hypothetical protein
LFQQTQSVKIGRLFSYGTEEGYSQSHLFTPQIVSSQLDYITIIQWLEFCRAHHKRLCGDKGRWSPGMKLIDCTSTPLSIADTPQSVSYAALSYVWGRNGIIKCTDAGQVLQASLPNVILDVVQVTRRLGLQFLWVDKLCIDQEIAETKHEQISRMDDIYRYAEITLIAAAGEDEDAGLPGVGRRPRTVQPTVQVGSTKIISSMTNPIWSIRCSRW